MYMANARNWRNLYSTDLCLGYASGVMQILGLASGVKQIFVFLNINMLVSPTRNSGVEGLDQCNAPTKKCASQRNIGFSHWVSCMRVGHHI